MRSGPGPLFGFRACSNFMMPLNDMLMSFMLVYFFWLQGGRFLGYDDLIPEGHELLVGRAV